MRQEVEETGDEIEKRQMEEFWRNEANEAWRNGPFHEKLRAKWKEVRAERGERQAKCLNRDEKCDR